MNQQQIETVANIAEAVRRYGRENDPMPQTVQWVKAVERGDIHTSEAIRFIEAGYATGAVVPYIRILRKHQVALLAADGRAAYLVNFAEAVRFDWQPPDEYIGGRGDWDSFKTGRYAHYCGDEAVPVDLTPIYEAIVPQLFAPPNVVEFDARRLAQVIDRYGRDGRQEGIDLSARGLESWFIHGFTDLGQIEQMLYAIREVWSSTSGMPAARLAYEIRRYRQEAPAAVQAEAGETPNALFWARAYRKALREETVKGKGPRLSELPKR